MPDYTLLNKSAAELIDELSVRIYEPPLNSLLSDLSRVPTPLRNLVLFLNFDTEVAMNGILGFLENSAGKHLSDTITAFEAIGATENARHLARIEEAMTTHGYSPERLRDDFEGHDEYEISTFEQLHGSDSQAMANEVETIADALYCCHKTAEDPYALLERYVQMHREGILAAVIDAE